MEWSGPSTPHNSYRAMARLAVKAGKTVGKHYHKKFKDARNAEGTPRRAVKDELGVASITVPVMGHVKKGVAIKKKHVVKVSKNFKEKVEKSLSSSNVHGYKKDCYFNAFNWGSHVFPDVQVVSSQNSGNAGVLTGQPLPYSTWDFLPEYFLDAASVLWNQKPATANGWRLTTANTIGRAVLPLTDVNANAVKFRIKDSWTRYLYRNLTQRGIFIKFFDCKPKRNSYLNSTVDTLTGTEAIPDAIIDPFNVWNQGLNDDNNEGLNISAVLPNILGCDPRQSPGFKRVFEVSVVEVYLEPGASYEFKLQGPNDFEWEYGKHLLIGAFQDIAKYSRFVMPVWHFDLAFESGGGTLLQGRLGLLLNAANGNLVCERRMYCSLEMPQETGFVTPPAPLPSGTIIDMGLRKDAYVENVWITNALTSTTAETTQPQTGTFTSNTE